MNKLQNRPPENKDEQMEMIVKRVAIVFSIWIGLVIGSFYGSENSDKKNSNNQVAELENALKNLEKIGYKVDYKMENDESGAEKLVIEIRANNKEENNINTEK